MNYPLNAQNISKNYHDKEICKNICFSIHPGDKIGLIGKNGSGKSSLLKILSRKDTLYKGEIISNDLKFGYLEQDPYVREDQTVFEAITEDVLDLRIALEKFENLQNYNPEILEYLETNNGFSLRERVKTVMKNVHINYSLSTPIKILSGGERMRVAFARILLSQPDILLLDEPTNHLDLYANLWLKNFLEHWKGGLLLVSHDRNFLDDVIHTIWELREGDLKVFGGNYSFYKEKQQEEKEAREREVIFLQKQIKKATQQIVHENERAAHSGRKALSKNPEDHDRLRANFFKEFAEKSSAKRKTKAYLKREKLSQKLEETKPKGERTIYSPFVSREGNPQGKFLIRTKNLAINYGLKNILSEVNIEISSGERIALFGNNGSGKTSLIRALTDAPSIKISGEIRKAEYFEYSILDQNCSIVQREKTVWENALFINPHIPSGKIRTHLAGFLFMKDKEITKLASELSGGELARLAFALITLKPLDFLILDEPTNNLDIASIEEIETALMDYPGTLFVISHDISFLKNLSIQTSYVLSEEKITRLKTPLDNLSAFKEELLSLLENDVLSRKMATL